MGVSFEIAASRSNRPYPNWRTTRDKHVPRPTVCVPITLKELAVAKKLGVRCYATVTRHKTTLEAYGDIYDGGNDHVGTIEIRAESRTDEAVVVTFSPKRLHDFIKDLGKLDHEIWFTDYMSTFKDERMVIVRACGDGWELLHALMPMVMPKQKRGVQSL